MYAEAILKHTVQNNTMKTPAVLIIISTVALEESPSQSHSHTSWKIRIFLKPFGYDTIMDAKEDQQTKWMKKDSFLLHG